MNKKVDGAAPAPLGSGRRGQAAFAPISACIAVALLGASCVAASPGGDQGPQPEKQGGGSGIGPGWAAATPEDMQAKGVVQLVELPPNCSSAAPRFYSGVRVQTPSANEQGVSDFVAVPASDPEQTTSMQPSESYQSCSAVLTRKRVLAAETPASFSSPSKPSRVFLLEEQGREAQSPKAQGHSWASEGCPDLESRQPGFGLEASATYRIAGTDASLHFFCGEAATEALAQTQSQPLATRVLKKRCKASSVEQAAIDATNARTFRVFGYGTGACAVEHDDKSNVLRYNQPENSTPLPIMAVYTFAQSAEEVLQPQQGLQLPRGALLAQWQGPRRWLRSATARLCPELDGSPVYDSSNTLRGIALYAAPLQPDLSDNAVDDGEVILPVVALPREHPKLTSAVARF